MPKKFKDLIINDQNDPENPPQILRGKIKGADVEVVTFEALTEVQEHVVNIDQNDIKLPLLKDQSNQDKKDIIPTGNELSKIEAITINGSTYNVLSGRLCNDNPDISPFYQLVIKKSN